jgi:hypothetical protein
MEIMYVSRLQRNYDVVTKSGDGVTAFGDVRLAGDYVIIGTSIFYKPEMVKEYKK